MAPSVMIPILGGALAGCLSWGLGGIPALTTVAAIGVVGGLGWMVARTFLNVNEVTEAALAAQLEQRARVENAELDRLAAQLRSDRDHRTQDCLTLLRSLRAEFEEVAQQPGFAIRSAQVREQVGHVFEAATDQLRNSFRLWERAESLSGETRDRVLAEREAEIAELPPTVERIQKIVEQFRSLVRTENQVGLAEMQAELEANLRVAQRTEERMREIENPSAAHEAFIRE
ncbi:hypothetical protein [Aureliella helgolandensis]|nr:hypothetical protein [Aureliella helgolandensis]